MMGKPERELTEKETWARFERAVDAAIKSGPKHRKGSPKKPTSFVAALQELGLLLDKPGVPREAIDGALQVVDRLDKCLFVELKNGPASATGDVDGLLQPSDLFLHYLAALRASDWPKVRIIEQEATS